MSEIDLSNIFKQLDQHFLEYIKEHGRVPDNAGFINCLSPTHPDRHPSMHIIDNGEHNKTAGYCFSCLPGWEEVETLSGPKQIQNLNIGENVFTPDVYGKVINKVRKTQLTKPIYSVSTENFHNFPVFLTGDHKVFGIKNMAKKVPYIIRNNKMERFDNRLKNRKRNDKYKKLELEEIRVEDLSIEDYLIIPISSNFTDVMEFDVFDSEINTDIAWLLGIYCAEGSTYRGGITFTLNRKEKEYQNKIIDILNKYNFKCSKYEYDYRKNTTNISCNSTKLQKFFEYYIGIYSDRKEMPWTIAQQSKPIQNAWLTGLLNGDASSNQKVLHITNKNLCLLAKRVCINLEKPFSFTYRPSYIGGDGVEHKESYILTIFDRERKSCFYDSIDGKRYCFMKVRDINETELDHVVYDIEIDSKYHSFNTNQFMVHNCHFHCDILHAAHALENKPLTGVGFYEETLPYLCSKYGIAYEPIQIDNKTRDMYQKRCGVRDAVNVIHGMAYLGANLNKDHAGIKHILDRGITEDSIKRFKIGVVNSFKEYIDAMTALGYNNRDWLASADLARKDIFSPNGFIIPIYDDKKRPVGFVTRTTKLDPNGKGEGKYINSINSDIYCKSEILFNFNNYDPNASPNLWIVEGYIDAIFLTQCGMPNVVALGSTAFTEQHVDLLSRYNVKNVILCLDGDDGGRNGTRLALEKITAYQFLKSLRVIDLPEGEDPDTFVRNNGKDALEAMANPEVALSAFAWTLKHTTFQDDPIAVVEAAIPVIAAEESTIVRAKMIRDLAKITGISKDDIKKDVELKVNAESDKFIEELTSINKYVQTALSKRKIRDTKPILQEALVKVKNIETKFESKIDNRNTYSDKLTNLWSKIEHGNYKYGLYSTKFQKFEQMFDGIPFTTCLTLVGGKPSTGKCLGPGTKVWTYDGLKKVEDIKIGDFLIGDDNTPRKVLSTTSGIDKMYMVHQENGISYKCNAPHVLSLKQNKNGKEVFTDIPLNKFIKKDKTFQLRNKGYKTSIEFEENDILIDPYFLGIWLGDGDKNSARIYNTDKEVIQYLYDYAQNLKLQVTENLNGTCPSYSITKGNIKDFTKFSLQQQLRIENLIGNKHIPKHYIINSRNNRLELLAGLIDSDGHYVEKEGCFEITQVHYNLIKDIKILADSLGFRTNINKKKTSIKKINFIGEAWRLNISGNTWEIPTKIKRKQAEIRTNKRDWTVSQLQIEEIEDNGEYFGFEIDGNGRFLLEDGTVTHNTTLLQALAVDIVESNEDAAVFFMSIDDTTELMTLKMLAQKTGFATSKIKQFNSLMSEEQQIITMGWNWLDTLSSRFIMVDANDGTSPEALEAHIEWFVKEFSDKKKVFFLDNFHKLTFHNAKEKRDSISILSEKVKDLTRSHDLHIMMTTELRKLADNDSRPTPADLKDTVQLEYDADAIIMIHNDLLVRENTNIIWRGQYGSEGERAMPYLETYVYKNKITGKTGGLAYKLDTYNLRVTEDSYATVKALKSQNAGHQIVRAGGKQAI